MSAELLIEPSALTEWKKVAGQMAQTNEDTEKAFLDAAYATISNKATPIMRSPYRVGFEVVFKNDDNTRIVGVFVFRVGQELYYAPVFFLNGAIKGTDLFYRANPKRFVPLTNDWVEYLVNLSETREGSGIPITERSKARNQLNMFMITDPPNSFNSRKYASEAPLTMDPAETGQVVKQIVEEWTKSAAAIQPEPANSILHKFIVEDGGHEAIAKLARAVQKDIRFAEALMLGSKPEHYAPELVVAEKAASAPVDLLVLHTGLLYNQGVKEAGATDLAKGYKFTDLRKEADVNDVVFADATQSLVSVDSPGIYKVMLADGTQHEMMCGYHHHLDLCDTTPKACDSSGSYYPRQEGQEICLVDLENRHSQDFNSKYTKPFGGFVRNIDPDKSERTDGEGELGVAKPSAGKGYRIFNTKTQTFSEPFYCVSTKNRDGLTVCTISNGWRLKDTKEIVVNPDYANQDYQERIFGKCCRFIEVAAEKPSQNENCCSGEVVFPSDLNLGDRYAVDRMIFDNGFKSATVKRRNQAFLIELDNRTHGEFEKLAATVFLMTRCDLTEAAAESVLAELQTKTKYAFYYEPKLTKSALNIRFSQWPEFHENVNSEYNVLQQPDNQWMIRADYDRPVIERNRIGDKYSGGSSNQDNVQDEALATRSPMDLYQLSQEKGMGSLFEHGVIAALVNTYDSMSMLEKYMPDLEQALDRLGRILFLFYWKPEDFTQAFGSDDQSQLENKLVSCFRSYGDLVLELLKKNRQNQQGTASLT